MMNLVMFGYFVTSQFFADMTDINLKEMMFSKKMKEIEDDVPPVGFIDDGLDDVRMEEEQRNMGWHDFEGSTGVEEW
ncbi:MAG: hypothetical protein CMA07_07340 [Euryarchaeota archaeon]|jgi:hypothetical protein|nr:hypothetical protein [Euryarchaeota archaeon]